MKIQIKDLKPNPFRDIKNYPINEEKVQSLTNSIEQTGFWDNILARKNNGKIEIAYGHHRLIALQRKFKPDHFVNIPIKNLDDATMIKIMANENDESWAITPGIIDETVRVTYEYLKKHFTLEESVIGKKKSSIFTNLSQPKNVELSRIAKQISDWLDGNWTERRVYYSLERLGLIEKGELDKEAVEKMPQDTYARRFTSAVKGTGLNHEAQRKAANRIVERGDFSKEGIEDIILEEKYPSKKPRGIKISELKKLIIEATQSANSLKGKIETLTSKMDEFHPEISEEKEELGRSLQYLGATIQYFIKLYKEKKNANKKGLLKN